MDPSGIYDIFFNDEFALQTSLGINEINFEIPFIFLHQVVIQLL